MKTKHKECLAVDEGKYGFDDENGFTGMIMYGDNEALVENARFYLKKYRGKRIIGWVSGVWKDGTFSDGIWQDGIWKDGTWDGGIWYNGTWENGTWKRGLWMDGKWIDGEGDRFSDDNTCFLTLD